MISIGTQPDEKNADCQNNPALPQGERNQLIEQYIPLIRKIAGYVIRNNAHRIDYEDLVNVGVIGLIQSLKTYNTAYDVDLATYCKVRIRGAMLDELRRIDWVPRRKRKQFKEIEAARQEFQQQFNRMPDSKELAEQFDIPANTLSACQNATHPVRMVSLNELISNEDQDSHAWDFIAGRQCESPDEKSTQNTLDEFTKGLVRTEQLVLILYYQEGLNMYQTGLLLGISESRVCQLHGQIIGRLRNRYQNANGIRQSAV